jgi:hypothetical protein
VYSWGKRKSKTLKRLTEVHGADATKKSDVFSAAKNI